METLKLRVLRTEVLKDRTHGILINLNTNEILCDTLEDRVRDINMDGDLDDLGEGKVYRETAIPYGNYKISVTYSNRFKKYMVLVHDVKHFVGIRMHYGRTAKNSEGCILVGKRQSDDTLRNIGMTDKLVDLLNKHGNNGTLEIFS